MVFSWHEWGRSCCANRKTRTGCGRGGGCHADTGRRVWTPAHFFPRGAPAARHPPRGTPGSLRRGDPLDWRAKVQGSQETVAALDTLEREGWVALARVASLRVPSPPPGPRRVPLKLAGFHGNQNNLAWAARVMPREGPAVRARVLRPPCPGAPATAEQPPPPPPLLALPELTSSPARRRRRSHGRRGRHSSVRARLRHPPLA